MPSCGSGARGQTDFTVDGANWSSYSGYYYGTVTFRTGEDTAEIIVRAVDDGIVEVAETLTLRLDDATKVNNIAQYYLVEEDRSATMRIVDNDVAPAVWIERIADASEDGEPGRFVLKRNDTRNEISVAYRINNGTARGQSDFTVDGASWNSYSRYYSGLVVFAAGQETAEIIVRAVDDNIAETTETLTLRLDDAPKRDNIVQYLLDEEGRSATMKIADNDRAPNVRIEQVADAAEGAAEGRFVVRRDDTRHELQVKYRVTGGTARGKSDYTVDGASWSGSGYYDATLVFAAGQGTAEIVVRTVDDNVAENAETLTLRLEDATKDNNGVFQYQLTDAGRTATMNIIDNDAPPSVWVEQVENAIEGAGPGRFILKRDNTEKDLQIKYRVTGGTASAGTDFTVEEATRSGSYYQGAVVFVAGKDTVEIVVHAVDDGVAEVMETLSIRLDDAPKTDNVAQYSLDESTRSAEMTVVDGTLLPTIWVDSTQNAAENGSNGFVRLRRDLYDAALTVYYDIDTNNRGNTNLAGWVPKRRGLFVAARHDKKQHPG